jgi:hypothetical protein
MSPLKYFFHVVAFNLWRLIQSCRSAEQTPPLQCIVNTMHSLAVVGVGRGENMELPVLCSCGIHITKY